MFSFFNKVTFDKRSGRPEAPIFWRLTTFFLICAWLMAFLLSFCAWLAVRDDDPGVAFSCGMAAVFILVVAHLRKRQIRKAEAEFQRMVVEYERAISTPSW